MDPYSVGVDVKITRGILPEEKDMYGGKLSLFFLVLALYFLLVSPGSNSKVWISKKTLRSVMVAV